jgi:hypothetical protein
LDGIKFTEDQYLEIVGISPEFLKNMVLKMNSPISCVTQSRSERPVHVQDDVTIPKKLKIKTRGPQTNTTSIDDEKVQTESKYSWNLGGRDCSDEVFAIPDFKKGISRFFIISQPLQYAYKQNKLLPQQMQLLRKLSTFKMVGQQGNGVKRVKDTEKLFDADGNPPVYKAKETRNPWRLLAGPVPDSQVRDQKLYQFNRFVRGH